MARPALFEEDADRVTVRIPKHLLQKAGGKNKSQLLATSLEQFLSDKPLSKVVQERDAYQGEMERLAAVVKRAKRQLLALKEGRKEIADLKRSLTQTIRQAVGDGRAKSMALYRRCVDDLREYDERIAVIEARTRTWP